MRTWKSAALGPPDLADPESLTRVLLDHMPEGVSLSREDGTIIYTNPAEDQLFGYEPGELLGQHVSVQNAYLPEENQRVVAAVIDELKRSGSWTGEWHNRRKDGTEFVTRSRITAVDINGERHWLCVQEDVTEEVARARSLAEERTRLKLATEAAELGIWDQDVLTGRMTYSSQAKSIFGFSETEEITSQRIYSVIHPEDRAHVEALARAARDPQVRSHAAYEYRILREDGSIRRILGHGEAIFEEVNGVTRAVRYLGTLQDITARHELEEVERASAQQLRLALGAGRMAVWDLDVHSNTVTGSSELYRLLGFPDGEPIDSEAARARYCPGEAERVSAEGAAALARGETSAEAEFRYLHPDLGVRWFRLRYEILFNGNTTPDRVIGVISDETERKQAEAQVRASEEELRSLADALPLLVSFIGMDERYRFMNKAHEVWFGRPRSELLGRTIREVLGDKAYEPRQSRIRAVLKGEQVRFDAVTPGAPGVRRDTEVYYLPRHSPAGEVDGFYGVVLDMTERRQAEAALQRETRSLAIVNETGAAVAAERDLDRIVQRVTDAGRELTGAQFGAFFYNGSNEQGESMMLYALSGVERSAFAKFPMPRATAIFRPTFHGEGVLRSDDILADPRYGKTDPHFGMPKGHLPVRSYLAVPVVSRSGGVLGGLFYGHEEPGMFRAEHETLLLGIAGHAATAVDNARLFQANESELAERRRAEAALQDLNATLEQRVSEAVAERALAEAALRQSQKMEAMGQLTGGVAHDFNNLLTPILGSLDRLQRKGLGDERDRRLMDGALQAAERARTLVQRLLAFARRQPLQPMAVDVAGLVHGIADLVASTTGPQIKVIVDVEHGVSAAYAEANQLEMAILNLAVNARDAMPNGGSLRISVSNQTVTTAEPNGVVPGRYVRLSVADTGQGMDEITLARAVEPFFSTKGVGKGTGLGLSMVHGLVAQLGGALTLQSSRDAGTDVALWLPVTEAEVLDAKNKGPVDEAADPLHRGTVLLVDDEDLVRATAADMLMDLGYDVTEASSADEALRLLDKGLSPSLLVTDHLMPGRTGTELARILKARYPDLAVLVVSGYADVEGLAPDLPRLTKPFRRAELAASLDQLRT